MKLSIHDQIKGKPQKVTLDNGQTVNQCAGQNVNLGYGWSTFECDPKDAFELITVDGCATSASLTNDNRAEQNFESRQMFMVDIDHGMTIEELLADDLYNNFGYGFYVTPSHTDEKPRFRIVFVAEYPIMNTTDARNLFSGLMKMYQHSDTACKDATRIFYGTIDCKIRELNSEYLPDSVIRELITIGQQENERIIKIVNNYQHDKKYRQDIVGDLLRRIAVRKGNLRGEYNDWLQIAWATCHTIGVHDAIILMREHFPEKTKHEMHAFNSWNPNESPTIGTLRYLSQITTEEFTELEFKYGYRQHDRILEEWEMPRGLRKHNYRG